MLLTLLGIAFYLSPRKSLMYVYGAQTMGQTFINSINFLQHDGCDVDPGHKGFNHSRNFTGWLFNYIFLNNGAFRKTLPFHLSSLSPRHPRPLTSCRFPHLSNSLPKVP